MLPPRTTAAQLDAALKAFAAAVGPDWLFATDSDRDAYLDAYALGDGSDHVAAAAVAPASAEEVQAILRLANEHRIPLWPISRGKNLGYGYSAPLLPGSVVLDLTRMNRILEVDEKHAYCVVEPGVGFFDLYDHLTAHGIPL
ncbi:MAG: FAD-binding oxidoreductase, partial [Gaiellaceae bacterium]